MPEKKNILKWLPDWTDESAYPEPDPDTVRGKIFWAWEFLRRNPRYQEAYRLYKQSSDVSERMLLGLEIAQKYGFRFKPVSPSRDDPFALTPAETADLTPEEEALLIHTYFNFSSPVRVLNNFTKLWGIGSSPVHSELITRGIGSDDVVMAFDLKLPAASHVEIAKKYIEDLQQLLKVKPQKHELHFDRFKD